jgi:hypothetical protein
MPGGASLFKSISPENYIMITARSYSLVILLALLVSIILSVFAPPLIVSAIQPKAQISMCSDADVALMIELDLSHCHYGSRMP